MMLEPVSVVCRDAELERLHAEVESAGTDSACIADLRAELSAAMSEVAAKVSIIDMYTHPWLSGASIEEMMAYAYHICPTLYGAWSKHILSRPKTDWLGQCAGFAS